MVVTGGDEPETPYAAEYPHNHVYESEAGHIREMDDTPAKERIHEGTSAAQGMRYTLMAVRSQGLNRTTTP